MSTHSLTHSLTQEYNQQATYIELVAKSSCHFALLVAAIFGMRNEVPKSLDGWCMNFRDGSARSTLCNKQEKRTCTVRKVGLIQHQRLGNRESNRWCSKVATSSSISAVVALHAPDPNLARAEEKEHQSLALRHSNQDAPEALGNVSDGSCKIGW